MLKPTLDADTILKRAAPVIRRNELQVWFVAEHIVNVPIVEAS